MPVIDDTALHPSPHQDPGPSEFKLSNHLSFEPGVRNDIVIQFGGPFELFREFHFIHDVELLQVDDSD